MKYFVTFSTAALFFWSSASIANAKEPAKEIALDLGSGATLEMVLIPAGEFKMGDERESDAEKPVHTVKITKPFYLGKHEITQQQWFAVTGVKARDHVDGKSLPIGWVTWDECQVFLTKLNSKLGVLEGKFVLPTEAQWEYACRAGSNKKFSFGDEASKAGEHAWFNLNSGFKPQEVGKKKPNAWGLYDMHGNQWEWCADWYDAGYYAKSPPEDPRGPATGIARVIRGGSGDRGAWVSRSGSRLFGEAGNWEFYGFRVARVVVP